MKDYKCLFPVYKKNPDLVYLDNAASALKPQVVIDAINDYYLNYSCNVERGVYKLCMDATEKVEESRRTIAKFIGANENEVVFTSGASESLNMVASMCSKILKEGDEIITTDLEHHSSFLPWLEVAKKTGAVLKFIPLDAEQKVTVENFKTVLSEKTKVLALTHVSNVLGIENPVKEIIEIAHKQGVICSIDGAQAIPHKRIDVKDMDCDFYSFSFHKLCGPTGLGLMYGKKELLDTMEPFLYGGEMNSEVTKSSVEFKEAPYKFEAGTLPIAEIFGAKAACDFIDSIGHKEIEERSKYLRNMALAELEKIPEVIIYNKTIDTTILTFNINGVHSHDSVSYICDDNICLRAGQHCAEILHKILCVNATLRASFYFYNDESDVKAFVKKVQDTVKFFKEVGYIA